MVFNRPETTRLVLDAIREQRPSRLFVAADGPRGDVPTDERRCEQVRHLIREIDWAGELEILFRDENLGCRDAVSGAIDWFLEEVTEGIILEDDCLPDPSFFRFCSSLLDRYRDEDTVMAVSGSKAHPGPVTTDSYYFSRYIHVWGWATWRRAWRHYDHEMASWPHLRDRGLLESVGDGHRDFVSYWRNLLDAVSDGEVDTWDYIWQFSCWARGGLGITPSVNLVSNIGFGREATHTFDAGGWVSQVPSEKMAFPLRHPADVVRHRRADRWEDLHLYRTKDLWTHRLSAKLHWAIPHARRLRHAATVGRRARGGR
jgi:hypothetical protein